MKIIKSGMLDKNEDIQYLFKKLKEDLLIKPSNLAMTESQKNNYLNAFFIKTVLNNK